MTETRRVVEVEVSADDAELVADVLWQGAPSAVAEQAVGGDRVRLTADVVEVTVLDRLPAGAAARILDIDGEAYLDAWRAWATPVRAGRRVLLQPAWLPLDTTADAEQVVVRLDPGRAFGSGSHPSTRLVIAALDDHLRAGDTVLDVGAGSGVLSVAACLLGAASAVAIDIDPAAVEATRANATANGVADRIVASTTAVGDLPDRFDLVVANIGVRVLRELAVPISDRVAPDGTLVLAGLLTEQADDVVAAYPTLREVARTSEEGWTAVVLA